MYKALPQCVFSGAPQTGDAAGDSPAQSALTYKAFLCRNFLMARDTEAASEGLPTVATGIRPFFSGLSSAELVFTSGGRLSHTHCNRDALFQ